MALTKNPTTGKRVQPQAPRVDRRWVSDSFNRGAQTLEEAAASARAMATAMERTGLLLRAPARQ